MRKSRLWICAFLLLFFVKMKETDASASVLVLGGKKNERNKTVIFGNGKGWQTNG